MTTVRYTIEPTNYRGYETYKISIISTDTLSFEPPQSLYGYKYPLDICTFKGLGTSYFTDYSYKTERLKGITFAPAINPESYYNKYNKVSFYHSSKDFKYEIINNEHIYSFVIVPNNFMNNDNIISLHITNIDFVIEGFFDSNDAECTVEVPNITYPLLLGTVPNIDDFILTSNKRSITNTEIATISVKINTDTNNLIVYNEDYTYLYDSSYMGLANNYFFSKPLSSGNELLKESIAFKSFNYPESCFEVIAIRKLSTTLYEFDIKIKDSISDGFSFEENIELNIVHGCFDINNVISKNAPKGSIFQNIKMCRDDDSPPSAIDIFTYTVPLSQNSILLRGIKTTPCTPCSGGGGGSSGGGTSISTNKPLVIVIDQDGA